jgi:hypothetical protein
MKKKGAGRPKLPKGQVRDEKIIIRLSASEKAKIEAQAKTNKQNPSLWARTRLLN